jgi:CHAD domain-containing protein
MAKPPRYGDIGPDEPLEVLANAVLRALWGAMLSKAPAALSGDDVEAVHDMRVAIRRLRSALRTFGDASPRKGRKRIAKSARRLGRALGGVRDADVHLAALGSALAGATGAEHDGIAYAIEQVGEERGRALARFATLLSEFDRDALEAVLADA